MKKLFAALIIMILVLSCVGCSNTADERSDCYDQRVESRFVNIYTEDGKSTELYYDSETYIIYYFGGYLTKFSYLNEYYSENGYLCRYNIETKQIEEIIH